MSAKTKKPLNILIIRLSAIGDIVFASPLIEALRGRYPDARITWLVQGGMQPLLELHPGLDQVISWPRSRWQTLLQQRKWLTWYREFLQFRRILLNHRFDLALDIQGLLKSGLLAWLSGAPERIGLGSREGSQWLMTRVVDRGGPSRRIGSEYLYLARQLGLPDDPFEMRIAIDASDERYVAELQSAQGLAKDYLVICPFTTRPQKHWFQARWVELIPRLQAVFGMPVIMLGGPGDREAAEQIADRVNRGLYNQVGVTSLRQAAALIKHAQLLIGVDTGLTHIGIAFNRPTIALFGSTCPYLDTTHDNALVIYHRLPCSPCKRNPSCDNRFDCMAAITVNEVLNQAERLLQTSGVLK
ncbi:MAG: lipopolysaccharide heptosyltransferase II [Chromatiales bacterium]